MGRKRKNITAADRDRWIARWYKNMADGFYEPYIRTHDLSSLGNKYRMCGPKSEGQSHHFLSYNEALAYSVYAFSTKVDRIYDQYPLLPVTKTIAIANLLGIRHPRYPVTNVYAVMSSDLIVRYKTGEIIAIAVKPENQLYEKRVEEKLAIEKAFWAVNDTEWSVLTDTKLRIQPLKTLHKLHSFWQLEEALIPIADIWTRSFCALLIENPQVRASSLIREASIMTGIEENQGDRVFRYSLWNKHLAMDWNQPLLLNKSAATLGLKSNVVG
jgi:hypothetical protein